MVPDRAVTQISKPLPSGEGLKPSAHFEPTSGTDKSVHFQNAAGSVQAPSSGAEWTGPGCSCGRFQPVFIVRREGLITCNSWLLKIFTSAGPVMATLAGLGVSGAVGGVVGALVGMGIPEYEAKPYEGRVRRWWRRCARKT